MTISKEKRDKILDKFLLVALSITLVFLCYWAWDSAQFRVQLLFAGTFIFFTIIAIFIANKYKALFSGLGFLVTLGLVVWLTYEKKANMNFLGWAMANLAMVTQFGYFYVNLGEKFGHKLRKSMNARGYGILASVACIGLQMFLKWAECLPHTGTYTLETLVENLLFTTSAILFFESVKHED